MRYSSDNIGKSAEIVTTVPEPMVSSLKPHTMRLLFILLLASCLWFPFQRASGQVLDKSVLNSTVLLTYEVEAPSEPNTSSSSSKDQPHAQGARLPKGGPLVVRGTGFLLFSGLGITRGSVYLVTNRHILPPEGKKQDIKVRVVVASREGGKEVEKVENISVPIVGADGKYLSSVRLHHDHNIDVAAINIGPAAFGNKFRVLIDAVRTKKYLDTSMLASSETMDSLGVGVGSQVFLLGYPAAIFDSRNVSPVLRVGVISTDPKQGFSFNDELRRLLGEQAPEHINGFLVDANVYPGSSGSLVVVDPNTAKCDCQSTNSPNSKRPEKRLQILGIVAGSIPIYDVGLNSYERIGLGIVYSADTIREVISSFER